MILKHPVTGHEVRTNKESVDFWQAAGYREPVKPAAKKAAASKSTTRKK